MLGFVSALSWGNKNAGNVDMTRMIPIFQDELRLFLGGVPPRSGRLKDIEHGEGHG